MFSVCVCVGMSAFLYGCVCKKERVCVCVAKAPSSAEHSVGVNDAITGLTEEVEDVFSVDEAMNATVCV